MKTVLYYCDRCGRKVSDEFSLTRVGMLVIPSGGLTSDEGVCSELEVCDECRGEIETLFKAKARKERRL